MPGESSQTLKFDLTDLYMAAPAFSRAGGSIADTVSQVQSQLQEMGAFWGNDAPGQKFASFYVHSADALLQQISVFAGAVEGIADAINKMADNYGICEEANVNKMRALEQEMQ
jgi:uncharacterized protein YukE